jgi:hypothetical protein
MERRTFTGWMNSVFGRYVLALAMVGLGAVGPRSVVAAQPAGRPPGLAAALGETPVCWQLVDEEEGEVLLRARLLKVARSSFLVTGVFVFASDGGTYPVTGNIEPVTQTLHMNLSTTNFGDFDGTHLISNLQFDFHLDPTTSSGPYEGIGPLLFGGQLSTITVKGTATFLGRCAE